MIPDQPGLSVVVPRVVPNAPSRTVAGNGAPYLLPLTHNGQRWCALAVQDYESRALPLSYGGGHALQQLAASSDAMVPELVSWASGENQT